MNVLDSQGLSSLHAASYQLPVVSRPRHAITLTVWRVADIYANMFARLPDFAARLRAVRADNAGIFTFSRLVAGFPTLMGPENVSHRALGKADNHAEA